MTVKCERLLLSSRAILQSGQVACKEVFWQTIRLEIKVPVRRSSGDDYAVKPHCTDWSKSCNWGWGFSSVFIIWASKPYVNAECTPGINRQAKILHHLKHVAWSHKYLELVTGIRVHSGQYPSYHWCWQGSEVAFSSQIGNLLSLSWYKLSE